MRISRRNLLATSGSLLAVGALPSQAFAAETSLQLVDRGLSRAELDQANVHIGQARPIDRDLVRQWRDGLCREVREAQGAVAYVRWDKTLLMSYLAREDGMTAQVRQLGRSVFAVNLRRSPRMTD